MAPRLTGIFVYPIKSLRGAAVEQGEVGPAGLRHDRRWMLVDPRGQFVTQRTEPRLARAAVTLRDGGYRLTVDTGSVDIPEHHDGPRIPVRVWASEVEAVVHAEGGALLSRWLDQPLRLVHLPDDVVRPAGSHAAPDDRVSLADAYPYLLIGEASLADLDARIADRNDDQTGTQTGRPPLTMARFRPNLVVGGTEPYAEDGWTRVRIGPVRFRGVKRCDRCVVTTLDPLTGEAGPEPLRTLATYRREAGKVWMGMNLVPDDGGVLRVGDPVSPTEG